MTPLGVLLPVALVLTGGHSAVVSRGEPRFVDRVAGVSYVVPAGWKEPVVRDLLSFATSVTTPKTEDVALLAAGRFADTFFDPSRGPLGRVTMAAAIEFAEFLYPVPGVREVLVDRAFGVDGEDGWWVRLRIVPKDADEGTVTVEMLAVAAAPARYVVAMYAAESHGRDIERVVRGVRLVPPALDRETVDPEDS